MKKSIFNIFITVCIAFWSAHAIADKYSNHKNRGLPDKWQQVINMLDDPKYGLEEIKREIRSIETAIYSPDYGLGEIKNEINDIKNALDSAGQNNLAPFKVVDSTGGICNAAATNSANPQILVESDGTEGNFVVTSILLKTAGTGVPTSGFFALSINSVTINGMKFDTRTGNLVGATDGSGVLESADLMGTPVRRSHMSGSQEPGGNFPHQIVANSYGLNDIMVRLFCRSDIEDLNISAVAVSGWKQAGENISVTYIPGN